MSDENDVLREAEAEQRQWGPLGDEPQPVPEGVNLYWGNDPSRDDIYELWRGEPVDHVENHQPFKMEVEGNKTHETVRWYARYGTVPFFTVHAMDLPFTNEEARFYRGVAKVDGTRTKMLWNGELGGDGPAMRKAGLYVVNRSPQELWSARLSDRPRDAYKVWDNMGGI